MPDIAKKKQPKTFMDITYQMYYFLCMHACKYIDMKNCNK